MPAPARAGTCRALGPAVIPLLSASWRARTALVALAGCAALAACNAQPQPRQLQEAPGPEAHPVTIGQPAKLSSIETGVPSGIAQDLRADCVTCHSLRESDEWPSAPEDLDEFHRGLTFEHGSLQCASCHVPGDIDALRLASGDLEDMADVMTVCSQCHGSQRRDYDRGAHGGMQGYWDLSRGPRTRNSCVDCHDPHAPAYIGGSPVLPPRDRFLPWKGPQQP